MTPDLSSKSEKKLKRIVCAVSYQGYKYSGFQAQGAHALNTIQGYLERAISQVANHPVSVVCSGRTDKGVHALSQVIHFDTCSVRRPDQWLRGVNYWLRDSDIRLCWVTEVSGDFHARFSASARSYTYWILEDPSPQPFLSSSCYQIPYELDVVAMHKASQEWLGEHDFSTFRSSGCQSKHARRCMMSIDVRRLGRFVVFSLKANAFLYHMVRNCVGTLIQFGLHELDLCVAKDILLARDRAKCGVMVPARGLYFMGADYGADYHSSPLVNSTLTLKEHPFCFASGTSIV